MRFYALSECVSPGYFVRNGYVTGAVRTLPNFFIHVHSNNKCLKEFRSSNVLTNAGSIGVDFSEPGNRKEEEVVCNYNRFTCRWFLGYFTLFIRR